MPPESFHNRLRGQFLDTDGGTAPSSKNPHDRLSIPCPRSAVETSRRLDIAQAYFRETLGKLAFLFVARAGGDALDYTIREFGDRKVEVGAIVAAYFSRLQDTCLCDLSKADDAERGQWHHRLRDCGYHGIAVVDAIQKLQSQIIDRADFHLWNHESGGGIRVLSEDDFRQSEDRLAELCGKVRDHVIFLTGAEDNLSRYVDCIGRVLDIHVHCSSRAGLPNQHVVNDLLGWISWKFQDHVLKTRATIRGERFRAESAQNTGWVDADDASFEPPDFDMVAPLRFYVLDSGECVWVADFPVIGSSVVKAENALLNSYLSENLTAVLGEQWSLCVEHCANDFGAQIRVRLIPCGREPSLLKPPGSESPLADDASPFSELCAVAATGSPFANSSAAEMLLEHDAGKHVPVDWNDLAPFDFRLANDRSDSLFAFVPRGAFLTQRRIRVMDELVAGLDRLRPHIPKIGMVRCREAKEKGHVLASAPAYFEAWSSGMFVLELLSGCHQSSTRRADELDSYHEAAGVFGPGQTLPGEPAQFRSVSTDRDPEVKLAIPASFLLDGSALTLFCRLSSKATIVGNCGSLGFASGTAAEKFLMFAVEFMDKVAKHNPDEDRELQIKTNNQLITGVVYSANNYNLGQFEWLDGVARGQYRVNSVKYLRRRADRLISALRDLSDSEITNPQMVRAVAGASGYSLNPKQSNAVAALTLTPEGINRDHLDKKLLERMCLWTFQDRAGWGKRSPALS